MGKLGKLGLAVIFVLLASAVGLVIWASTGPGPQPEALAAMRSDESVTVETDRWLVFRPVGTDPSAGLIFYPGGRVDPRAYGPPARAIAAEGLLVVVAPMPLDLAVLNVSEAADVMKAFPTIEHWGVGGHSLGGAMAASFADSHQDQIKGLVLWAAYPAESNDLSDSDLKVVSIYGTRDGLATREKIDASRALLPRDTQWVAIEGGNHAQFGWYGTQSGDNPATIGHKEQQERVVSATVALLESLTTRSAAGVW
jgi:pimeloyl-ACP methyl ester carboxylesterase